MCACVYMCIYVYVCCVCFCVYLCVRLGGFIDRGQATRALQTLLSVGQGRRSEGRTKMNWWRGSAGRMGAGMQKFRRCRAGNGAERKECKNRLKVNGDTDLVGN